MSEEQTLATRASLLANLKDLEDQCKWQQFYDKYRGFLEGIARRHQLSDTDREEVIQETVIAVARQVGSFNYDKGRGNFRSWLATIVRRKVVDAVRKMTKAAESTFTTQVGSENNECPGFDEVWEEEWELHALDRAKKETLKRVSNKQFQVYDWYVLRGHSKSDVCDKFRIKGNQVDIAKHRVGKVLEEEISKLREGEL